MNKETIVKTCKCGEKHYFTNCYNEVYNKQKELIDKIKDYIYDLEHERVSRSIYLGDILDLIKEYEEE